MLTQHQPYKLHSSCSKTEDDSVVRDVLVLFFSGESYSRFIVFMQLDALSGTFPGGTQGNCNATSAIV